VIVISMLLVIIAFVTLMLGVLNITIAGVEPLTFVYATIAACLLAGLFLVVGVLRSRPSRKPAVASGSCRSRGAPCSSTSAATRPWRRRAWRTSPR
jgi:hypothetical protein